MTYHLTKWQRFWRLTLLWESKRWAWWILERCICDCGNEKRVSHTRLIKWTVMSCWCLLSDTAREKQKNLLMKHGLRTWKNRFSRIYQWMRRRCKNPNDRAYPQYWWRWIQIERNNIEEFYNDMHESYLEHCKQYWERNTTIDRVDCNGNYSKENCKWSTYKEQQNNRTNNSLITIDWVTYNPTTFADKFKVNYNTAKYRMRMYRNGKMSYETLTHIWTCFKKTLPPKEDGEWDETTK